MKPCIRGGTIVLLGDRQKRRFGPGQDGEFVAADSLENGLQKSPLMEMRQGIASRCGHVAPALLLC